jgi:dienelactone hydrolase
MGGETGQFTLQGVGPVLHWLTLVILCVLPIIGALVLYKLGSLPGSIARARNHPQADAISIYRRLGCLAVILTMVCIAAKADGQSPSPQIQEEYWAFPVSIPMRGHVFRPTGDGPFPLVIMNHGISNNVTDRGYFPQVEFPAAARWFAGQGYLVVVPIRPGYGQTAADIPELGFYSINYTDVGSCTDPNFRDPGLAVARMNQWVIEYMVGQGIALPSGVVVVGQSGGGWGSIALSSENPREVRAIITFEAGRGGRVDGKPNNNCAPDKLVEATRDFGRTSRVPMLWIYTENDTFFGPALSKRMHEAFNGAGGNAKYHLLPPFGSDGHFFIDSPDAIPIWSPLVKSFLENHR